MTAAAARAGQALPDHQDAARTAARTTNAGANAGPCSQNSTQSANESGTSIAPKTSARPNPSCEPRARTAMIPGNSALASAETTIHRVDFEAHVREQKCPFPESFEL